VIASAGSGSSPPMTLNQAGAPASSDAAASGSPLTPITASPPTSCWSCGTRVAASAAGGAGILIARTLPSRATSR
jgi:hypothetical protein